MKWALRLGRVAGIDVFVHATFFIFLVWVGLSGFLRTGTTDAAIDGVLFMLAVFGTVVLHELGHALTARRFGITTRDITLLPIGGVARLERMPDKPSQELLVALAGPAVNVAFAVGFWLALRARGISPTMVVDAPMDAAPLLVRLFWVNVSLAVFNLLPAFPMDGGRALRGLLALRGDYVAATRTAANLGQAIAFVLGILGLFGNPMLVFVALFVWIGAASESHAVQTKNVLHNVPVQAAMITDYTVLSTTDSLATAAETLLRGSQVDFPVVDGSGAIVGVLPRTRLIEGLAQGGAGRSVESAMIRRFQVTHPREMLDVALARLEGVESPVMPVVDHGAVVGLVTLDNVGELLMVTEALRKQKAS